MSNQINSVVELEDHLEVYFSELSRIHSDQSNEKLACKEGCSFCCHLHITLKPYELLPLMKRISALPEEKQEILLQKVETNCSSMDDVSDEEVLLINYDCPFLDEDNCTIYSERPTSCRSAHSTSKTVCEEAFKFPSLEIEANHVIGFVDSVRDYEAAFENLLGEYHDVSDYNMNYAIKAALKDPEWITRFLEGDEVFDDSVLSRV